ncbi:MAG: hypothetical protein ACR2O1_01100 [Boseongicola sp.]
MARLVPNLLELLEELKRKGTDLRISATEIDTSTATGKLTLERQREDIAKAKAMG